jgi:DNA-binding transcriptional regulator GbsR (MarR family)
LDERVGRLLAMLVWNVEPLLLDEVDEVREAARRIVIGYEEDE